VPGAAHPRPRAEGVGHAALVARRPRRRRRQAARFLDGLALAAQRMRELVDAGGADLDSAALARVVRENLRR